MEVREEPDSQIARRKAILAVMRDGTLDAQEKQRRVQLIMVSKSPPTPATTPPSLPSEKAVARSPSSPESGVSPEAAMAPAASDNGGTKMDAPNAKIAPLTVTESETTMPMTETTTTTTTTTTTSASTTQEHIRRLMQDRSLDPRERQRRMREIMMSGKESPPESAPSPEPSPKPSPEPSPEPALKTAPKPAPNVPSDLQVMDSKPSPPSVSPEMTTQERIRIIMRDTSLSPQERQQRVRELMAAGASASSPPKPKSPPPSDAKMPPADYAHTHSHEYDSKRPGVESVASSAMSAALPTNASRFEREAAVKNAARAASRATSSGAVQERASEPVGATAAVAAATSAVSDSDAGAMTQADRDKQLKDRIRAERTGLAAASAPSTAARAPSNSLHSPVGVGPNGKLSQHQQDMQIKERERMARAQRAQLSDRSITQDQQDRSAKRRGAPSNRAVAPGAVPSSGSAAAANGPRSFEADVHAKRTAAQGRSLPVPGAADSNANTREISNSGSNIRSFESDVLAKRRAGAGAGTGSQVPGASSVHSYPIGPPVPMDEMPRQLQQAEQDIYNKRSASNFRPQAAVSAHDPSSWQTQKGSDIAAYDKTPYQSEDCEDIAQETGAQRDDGQIPDVSSSGRSDEQSVQQSARLSLQPSVAQSEPETHETPLHEPTDTGDGRHSSDPSPSPSPPPPSPDVFTNDGFGAFQPDEGATGIEAFVAEPAAVDALQVSAVMSEDEEKRAAESKQRRYIQFGCLCLCILLIAIITPTSIVLTQNNEKIIPLVEESEMPSMAPSGSPTSSLFAQFTDVIQQLYEDSGDGDMFDPVFSDFQSSQYRSALWATNQNQGLLATDKRMMTRYLLATFYYATDGENWLRCSENSPSCEEKQRWLIGADECEWFMIDCDENGEVTEIFVPPKGSGGEVGMAGTLPHDIGFLTQMTQMILSFNSIGGTLPDALSRLTNLQDFVLFDNEFTGTLPPFFFNGMDKLKIVETSSNNLVGPLPSLYNSTTLREYRAYNNSLTGTIPTEIGGLKSLVLFELNGNQLTGEMPTELFSLPLLSIFLHNMENFGGSLPPEIGQLSKLRNFQIDNTAHGGDIPEAFYNLSRAEDIRMSNCSFTGPLSDSLAGLENLEVFELNDNDLTGEFPSDILAKLQFLRHVELQGNNLYGNVTQELCDQRGENVFSIRHLTVDCNDPPDVLCNCCENCTEEFP